MSVVACYQEDPWLEATCDQEIDHEQLGISNYEGTPFLDTASKWISDWMLR